MMLYVWMYVCRCVRMYAWTEVRTYVHARTRMLACMHVGTCVSVSVYVCVYVCIYVCMYVCVECL